MNRRRPGRSKRSRAFRVVEAYSKPVDAHPPNPTTDTRNLTSMSLNLPLAFGFGGQEMLLFGLVMLLLFGSAKLPKLMRDLGRSTNEFKAGMKEPVDDESTTNPSNRDVA